MVPSIQNCQSSYWLIGTPSITLQENLQPGCSLAGAHASASIVSGHHCLRKSHKAKATKSDTILKLESVFSTQETMFSPATTELQRDGPMAPLQLEMVHCPTVSRPHQASFGGDTLIRSCTTQPGATDPDHTQPGATDPDLILPISLPKDTTRSQSAEPNSVTVPPPAPTVASTSASPSNLGTQPRRSGRIAKPPVKLNL